MKIEDLPKISDKIHLPTSVTALSTISRLMKEVVLHEPLTPAASKPLFMAAKADGIRKKAANADTHTEGTFRSFGLIEYLDGATKLFRSTPLGREVAGAYDIDGHPQILPDEITALSLRVLCSWKATNEGRDIHPGRMLLDLLCDVDVDGYITEHEFTNFLIDPAIKNDSQYDQIKASLLEFRAKGADAICDYTETCKTYLFLPSFVNKWNLLRKARIFDFVRVANSYRWTMGADAAEDDEGEDVSKGDLFSKHSKVTEYRLLPGALKIYKRLVERKGTVTGMSNSVKGPLQRISYGAPGTGKSKGVNDVSSKMPKEDVVRTTFHPDSDYSTFVGAYKPKMKCLPRVAMESTKVKRVTCDEGFSAQEKEALEVEKKIAYEFVPQAFAKAYVQAWKRMVKPVDEKVLPVMLVIEEINRGDCAKIFGDLFQLLDRRVTDDEQNPNDAAKKVGFSEYPVLADSDLADYIRKELSAADVKAAIEEKYPSVIAAENLQLMLPPNLYIWATMNTSDQSLFPMDSAFKRRWEWQYVPISKPDKEGDPTWKERKIKVGEATYDWWTFLTIINKHIAKATESEDKQLGYFFVKAPDDTGLITAEQFANKVLFYLYGDVFKSYDLPAAVFKREGGAKWEFRDFFHSETSVVLKADGTIVKDANGNVLKTVDDAATQMLKKPGDVNEFELAAFLAHLKWTDASGKALELKSEPGADA